MRYAWRGWEVKSALLLAMLVGLTVSRPALAQPSCESLTSLNFACGPPLQGAPIAAVSSVPDVPFTNGRFEGTGHWINQQAEGDYTVTYSITDNGGGGKRHAVRRLFQKPDGSLASEENTTVIFTPTTRNRMRVSIASANGTDEGQGYCLGDQCHYEATISPGEQMEFTFTVTGSRIDGLASSTNKGNFTSWRETLSAR